MSFAVSDVDRPAPLFLGGFADANGDYELPLWRDSRGIFGELLHPVLEADSPGPTGLSEEVER